MSQMQGKRKPADCWEATAGNQTEDAGGKISSITLYPPTFNVSRPRFPTEIVGNSPPSEPPAPPPDELRTLDYNAWWQARRRYLLAQAASYFAERKSTR